MFGAFRRYFSTDLAIDLRTATTGACFVRIGNGADAVIERMVCSP